MNYKETELQLRKEELEIRRGQLALDREKMLADRKERDRRFELESKERMALISLLLQSKKDDK